MKTRLIGLAVLLAVITGAAFYAFSGGAKEETEITGYVGGEKIGLLEDEEVIRLMEKKYGLRMDYAKAGSMDMVTADHSGRDFLFPSSQTALASGFSSRQRPRWAAGSRIRSARARRNRKNRSTNSSRGDRSARP